MRIEGVMETWKIIRIYARGIGNIGIKGDG